MCDFIGQRLRHLQATVLQEHLKDRHQLLLGDVPGAVVADGDGVPGGDEHTPQADRQAGRPEQVYAGLAPPVLSTTRAQPFRGGAAVRRSTSRTMAVYGVPSGKRASAARSRRAARRGPRQTQAEAAPARPAP
jgi:hypothetical protein